MRWCRLTFRDAEGTVVDDISLEGPGAPDLRAVDEVARLALLAKRLGGRLSLAEVAPDLLSLLLLSGLGIEVEGQPEGGEQPLRIEEVEEEAHSGDPTA